MKRLLGFLFALTVILSLAACGDNNVYLDMDDVLLQTGESFTLAPRGLPEGFTVADCALSLYTPVHSPDEKDVVRVDDTGTVTALQTGSQRVHCELNYKGKCYLASCSVEVVDALVLDAESIVLIQGEHCALAAKSASGASVGPAVQWESGDASIASVAEDTVWGKHNETVITAKAAGEATVTASLGDELQAVCRVTVLANDDVETYRYYIEQGEYEFVWGRLAAYCSNNWKYNKWLTDKAPEALQSAYAYPVDMLVELYDGQEAKIESTTWKSLCEFGFLPVDELDLSIARIRPAAGVYRAFYDNANDIVTYYGPFVWQNAMDAAQYASLGAQQCGKAIIVWTGEKSYEPYTGRQLTPDFISALFGDGIAAAADCGLTALLPEPMLPERLEDVEYVIELKMSGVQDDTKYYYSDTKELVDDLTVIKTRVTCLLWQVRYGRWTQVYDAGYAEGDMPKSDFYQSKLVVGYPPSDEQLWPRISDAVEHIPE